MTSTCFLFLTGLFAAAHDDQMEWLIVKGVASDRDLSQSVSDDWKYFASAMAASLVANILSNPIVFKEWPHHNQGKCYCWKMCVLHGKSLIFQNSKGHAVSSVIVCKLLY